jgi:membrane associated rhomboid family serine protease
MFIPISDENPTLRFPLMTVLLLIIMGVVWVMVQGAGFNPTMLAASVCNLGLVPGELTGRAHLGQSIPLGPGLACVVDSDPINILTPLTSMFLHGSWMHLLSNALFLWIFGNNIEDSMGRLRFLIFYLLCGLAAAAAQVFMNTASPVPMVGASGAISGVLGAYLLLYPKVRVKVLVFVLFIFIIHVPAYLVLLWWIGLQIISALPQLNPTIPEVSGGVAVFAHIGGFFAGVALVRVFRNAALVGERTTERHRLHPGHY